MKTFAAVLVGSSLVAFGLNGFIIPCHLMDGGIIGIGLIIKYLFGINVGLTTLFLNLPIYFMAWKYYRHDFFHSVNGFLTSSLLIDLFSPLRSAFHLPIDHSALLGGTLIGLGTGLMLRYHVCTEGLDFAAQCISVKTPFLNVGLLIFSLDLIILVTGHKFIGGELIYSVISITAVGLATTLVTVKGAGR